MLHQKIKLEYKKLNLDMKPLTTLILVIVFTVICIKPSAQPKWLSYQFSNKVSLQTALIKINNKPASYDDLIKIADSSLLKVEVYSKKRALEFVDKNEAKNGLVLVTMRKKVINGDKPPKQDSVIYIINDNGDTIICKTAIPATINGDTSNVEWVHFL